MYYAFIIGILATLVDAVTLIGNGTIPVGGLMPSASSSSLSSSSSSSCPTPDRMECAYSIATLKLAYKGAHTTASEPYTTVHQTEVVFTLVKNGKTHYSTGTFSNYELNATTGSTFTSPVAQSNTVVWVVGSQTLTAGTTYDYLQFGSIYRPATETPCSICSNVQLFLAGPYIVAEGDSAASSRASMSIQNSVNLQGDCTTTATVPLGSLCSTPPTFRSGLIPNIYIGQTGYDIVTYSTAAVLTSRVSGPVISQTNNPYLIPAPFPGPGSQPGFVRPPSETGVPYQPNDENGQGASTPSNEPGTDPDTDPDTAVPGASPATGNQVQGDTPPLIIVGGEQIESVTSGPSSGAVVVGGSTINPGQSATLSNKLVASVAATGGLIVVGDQTAVLPSDPLHNPLPTPAPAPSIFTINNVIISPVSTGGAVVYKGITILPGSSTIIESISISNAPSGGIVVVNGLTGTVNYPSTITPPPSPHPSSNAIPVVFQGETITPFTSGSVIVSGTTLAPGAFITLADQHLVSILGNGTVFIDGSSTSLPTITPTTHAITMNNTVTPNSTAIMMSHVPMVSSTSTSVSIAAATNERAATCSSWIFGIFISLSSFYIF